MLNYKERMDLLKFTSLYDKLFAIKETVQELEDDKNALIIGILKECGWDYIKVPGCKEVMFNKRIVLNKIEQCVCLTQEQAFSFQLLETLSEENEDE